MRSVLLTVVVFVVMVVMVAEMLDVVFGFLHQDVQPLA